MKTFKLIHKRTGEEAAGTYEMVPGSAVFSSVTLGEDGEITFNYCGDTNIFWDDQKTQRNPVTNEIMCVTEDGDIYPISEFNLVEQEDEDDQGFAP